MIPDRTVRVPSSLLRRLVQVARLLTALMLAVGADCPALGAEKRDIPAPDGPTLAASVRQMVPDPTEVRGTLVIRRGPGKRIRVPIRFETIVGENNWRAVYEVNATNGMPSERLSVIHGFDQPNQYFWNRSTGSPASNAIPGKVANESTMVAFAGSDFWLADLGLEFLHWPEQRLLKEKNGMRKSRYCRVLESLNPHPGTNDYARVVSWIDHEFGGVILAEAYDARRKLVKSFEIDGVTEVADRWQLKAMEILDYRTDSLTRMEFNYTLKPPTSP